MTAWFQVGNNGSMLMPPEIKGLKIQIGDGLYRMGVGGLHSSEKKTSHIAGEDFLLVDRDVRSYYPEIILKCLLAPTHLGMPFLRVYGRLVSDRLAAKAAGEETTANSLKIVVNGSFASSMNRSLNFSFPSATTTIVARSRGSGGDDLADDLRDLIDRKNVVDVRRRQRALRHRRDDRVIGMLYDGDPAALLYFRHPFRTVVPHPGEEDADRPFSIELGYRLHRSVDLDLVCPFERCDKERIEWFSLVGAEGMAEIKKRGGITIVQHPDDAVVASMPKSALSSADIDHVLSVDEIPKIIGEIIAS
jgi:hypothetical protein